MIQTKSFDFSGPAVDILRIFRQEPFVFLLESSLRRPGLGRYSFIGFDPFDVFVCSRTKGLDALARKFYSVYDAGWMQKSCRVTPFPFGIMGFLGYEFGLSFEQIDCRKKRTEPVPDGMFGFYDTVMTIDHREKKLHITACGLPERQDRLRRLRAGARIEHISRKIFADKKRVPRDRGLSISRRFPPLSTAKTALTLRSNLTRTTYGRAVQKALDYIREGEIYQVNLAQRFSLEWASSRGMVPFEIYQRLRQLSPSCFGSYFDGGNFQIISSSPERFLSLNGREVETRPMKGTRPRGMNKTEDACFRRELMKSDKDQAELLMITDLERNDLGRVCRPGSIYVPHMRTLERYRTVYQTTSTVKGTLRPGKNAFDLLKATFPGGSISGCPKIRAMQIIEELEPSDRSIYTGCLGYISPAGRMDFNILIRTLLVSGRRINFHVGGGIVADSKPEKEYEETLVKARAMKDCLEQIACRVPRQTGKARALMFLDGNFEWAHDERISSYAPGHIKGKGAFETMRAYEGKVFLLEEHLKRLAAGLRKQGVVAPYGLKEFSRLIHDAEEIYHHTSVRIRLAVWTSGGKPHVSLVVREYRPYSRRRYTAGFRACFSPAIYDETAPLSGIKSIDYGFYQKALDQAQTRGFDEALILNRKGEVVEGTKTNIFLVKNGRLITPSLKSGCLPGITRRLVLKMARQENIPFSERPVFPPELFQADEVFLTNSLMEIMPAASLEKKKIGAAGKSMTGKLQAAYGKFLHVYAKE